MTREIILIQTPCLGGAQIAETVAGEWRHKRKSARPNQQPMHSPRRMNPARHHLHVRVKNPTVHSGCGSSPEVGTPKHLCMHFWARIKNSDGFPLIIPAIRHPANSYTVTIDTEPAYYNEEPINANGAEEREDAPPGTWLDLSEA